MFFNKIIPAAREKATELVVLEFQEFSSEIVNKFEFTEGLEIRLNDREISEEKAKEFFNQFENFKGSKLVFNFTNCTFIGNIGKAIAVFLNEKYAPSELKFYFSYLEFFSDIAELVTALGYAPQKILRLDFDYSLFITDDIVSSLVDAIKTNKQLQKISLNFDAANLTLNAAKKLLECLKETKHLLLYADECGAESEDPTVFKEIRELTKARLDLTKLVESHEYRAEGKVI